MHLLDCEVPRARAAGLHDTAERGSGGAPGACGEAVLLLLLLLVELMLLGLPLMVEVLGLRRRGHARVDGRVLLGGRQDPAEGAG